MHFNTDDTSIETLDTQSGEEDPNSDGNLNLAAFWPKVVDEIKKIKHVDAKNQVLPLARIKKIMKLDEDVKMISAEAPLLFAKASEIFIHELTLRAWIHTEDNKRRTLQKNDIAMAITKYDQFDFLIDIVPRDEIKPKRETETKIPAAAVGEQQYYFQIAQQALQGSTSQQAQQTAQMQPQTLQLQSPTGQQLTLASPQNIILTSPNQQQMLVNNVQPQQQPQQHIQLVQQVVTPNGEITHIPLSPSQLNILRMQMQNNQPQQPIIIQSPQINQQLIHPGQQTMTVYQNQQQQPQHISHHQQHQQHQQHNTSTDD